MARRIKYTTLVASLLLSTAAFSQQGFFLDDHQPKSAVIPTYNLVEKPTAVSNVVVNVDFDDTVAAVSQYVFGNNANVYMTQMVDQPDLLARIRELSPNVIRFPGGNLSSVYFWNALKNQPPADAPAKLVDAQGAQIDPGYWYGKNSEGWTLSVDNYYEMLEQTNSTGIITINYGYARYGTSADPVASAAHHAADWVRYDNGRTKFWEIGNESNGSWQAGFRIDLSANKDGQPQLVNGELYGTHFKVFADSMRKAASEKGHSIYIGAQLLGEAPAGWWNDTDRFWNEGVFEKASDIPDFYIVHSYYTPFATNSSAADILNSADDVTHDIMQFVTGAQLAAGVSPKPLALTEWNIFAEGSRQQASYINGIHAAIALGSMIGNKYGLAARWDLANGWSNGNDHGMFSQGDEPNDVPRWTPRAAFYYMTYFQKYFGDFMVASEVEGSSDVLAYASRFSSGEASVVLVNKGTAAKTVSVNIADFGFGERYYFYTLTGGSDNGDFSLKVSVNGQPATFATGGPLNYKIIKAQAHAVGGGLKVTLPARSVQYVLIEAGDNFITANSPDKKNAVSVFPNPAKTGFTVELPAGEFTSWSLINAHGSVVRHNAIDPAIGTLEISQPELKGVYILKLESTSRVIRKKIVFE